MITTCESLRFKSWVWQLYLHSTIIQKNIQNILITPSVLPVTCGHCLNSALSDWFWLAARFLIYSSQSLSIRVYNDLVHLMKLYKCMYLIFVMIEAGAFAKKSLHTPSSRRHTLTFCTKHHTLVYSVNIIFLWIRWALTFYLIYYLSHSLNFFSSVITPEKGFVWIYFWPFWFFLLTCLLYFICTNKKLSWLLKPFLEKLHFSNVNSETYLLLYAFGGWLHFYAS